MVSEQIKNKLNKEKSVEDKERVKIDQSKVKFSNEEIQLINYVELFAIGIMTTLK